MKKRSEETQTLRAGCSKAEPKIFAPPQTASPGAQDGQNLISWRWSLPSPTDPVWWRSVHAISSYRGNRPTNKQTGPITIHCATKLGAQWQLHTGSSAHSNKCSFYNATHQTSYFAVKSKCIQETQLSLTNRATRLEVSQGHQTIRYVTCGFLLVFYGSFVPKTFLRYSTCKYSVTLKPCLGVTQGHWNRHRSIRHLWFPIIVQ